MNLFKFIALILATLCFQSMVLAQPAGPQPPKIKVTFSNNSPTTGDEIDVIFQMDLPEGYHLYSTYTKCGEFGPLISVFTFKPNGTYKLIGNLESVGDKHVFDETFECEIGEFFNKGVFRQKIKVLKTNLDISGHYDGQWCNEGACFPLTEIPFKASLKASGKEINVVDIEKIDTTTVQSVDTPAVVVPTDTSAIDTSANCPTCSYKLNGGNDNAPCTIKKFNGASAVPDETSYWSLFVLAFLSGLIGLLTPCVFPMIPMTVSFFMKDDKNKNKARFTAIFFGLSIIFIYTVLGTLAAIAFGPDAGNFLSTHWFPNILFFVIFIVFAFSFFGAFEIVLPSSLANKADKEADKGGLYGAFFMALTLAIVSFSCTGPIVGNVLVGASTGGERIGPVIAMFGFGLAFALPFTLFALFPSMLSSLPKSGGWLNAVKVCLGFLELAFALKFLSVIDQTYHWRLLDREVYLVLWIAIFSLMGIYLLGKLKFAHDSDLKFIKVPRLLFAILTFSFVMYLIPGLWGAPLKTLAGYLPPMSTQDFDIERSIREANGMQGNICKKPSYASQLHLPHGLNGYYDYDEAVACAKELKKPLFIDFTGHGCVNCRKMEEKVWSDPRVLKILKDEYVIASLYVDDKKIKLDPSQYFIGRSSKKQITTLGKKNTEIEACYFGANSQPLYCLLDKKEDLLQKPVGTEINNKSFDADEFYKFLEEGVKEYKKRNK